MAQAHHLQIIQVILQAKVLVVIPVHPPPKNLPVVPVHHFLMILLLCQVLFLVHLRALHQVEDHQVAQVLCLVEAHLLVLALLPHVVLVLHQATSLQTLQVLFQV